MAQRKDDEAERLIAEQREEEIIRKLAWPTMPKTPITVADMSAPIDWDMSPQCTYCVWWEPGDGRFCPAWPARRRKPIPEIIWKADPATGVGFLHTRPFGGEQCGEDGQPILFQPDPAAPVAGTADEEQDDGGYSTFRLPADETGEDRRDDEDDDVG
jgi:hypothetical protein